MNFLEKNILPDVVFSLAYNRLLCFMQGWIRAIWRFFYFAFSTTYSIVGFAWLVLLGNTRESAGLRIRRRWLNHVPARLGVQMKVYGTPHPGPCLYVGNHITYIDPIAVLMHVEANVVAKAEVSRWPIIGWGAYIVGTIFVQREEKTSRQEAASSIREALKSGISIIVFPEGTTTAGPGTLPFRPRSFEAAYLAGVPVQPIAILYESFEVAYIDDHTFLPHFFSLFRMKKIRGRIAFGPALYGEHTCDESRQWIEATQALGMIKPDGDECA